MSESLLLAGDRGFEEACRDCCLADDLRPFAIGRPRTEAELAEMIRLAVSHGLRVRPMATAAVAESLADGEVWDVVVLRTDDLPDGVDVSAALPGDQPA